MRATTITICFLFLQTFLNAQTDVLVLHVNGQVLYYAQTGAKPVPLYSGMHLGLTGRVRCKGAATAKMVYNGKAFLVSGTKMRDVQDIVKSAGKASQMSFTGRFFDFVTESVKEGDNPENVKKHHRKYMGKTRGGIKGFAGYTITPLLFTTGQLPPAKVMFNWRPPISGEGPYTFKLNVENSDTIKTIAQILVKDTVITLDLEQLALDLEKEYTWSVSSWSASKGALDKSPPIRFKICPESVVEQHLSHEPAFLSAEHIEQQLMLAYSLEEGSWYYVANNTYKQLLDADPNNVLLRRMYTTFLARMEMLPEANAMLLAAPK